MIGDGVVRPFELIDALNSDLATAFKLLEEDRDSQYLRRSLVRALFSYVEAIIECVKVELRSTVTLEKSFTASGN